MRLAALPPARLFLGMLSPEHRHALRVLADCPNGYTEALPVTHGVSFDAIIELLKTGLARAEHVTVGGKLVERVKITQAGQVALEDTE
jgi:hypothetical protein